jgi:4'-phosphopantetheinyl transferase
MTELATELGPGVTATSSELAIQSCKVVALAIPWRAWSDALKDAVAFSGKIVIDAMNAYDPYPYLADLGGTGSSELVAKSLSYTHVVKAFNSIREDDLKSLARPRGSSGRIALPLCGEDSQSRLLVTQLVDAAGFDALDLGQLRYGRWFEPGAPLFGKNRSVQDLESILRQCIKTDLATQLGPDEVCVRCFYLRPEPHLLAMLYETLSARERESASGFHDDELRNRFVLSRGLLRIQLAGYCGTSAESLAFTYGPNGKPSLAFFDTIGFNVSHSGEIAAYAFTKGAAVGVDIEQHKDLPEVEKIARRFFSSEEYDELMEIPQTQRREAFFGCWTRKEAYIKARGGGLSIPLDSFQVSVAQGRPAALLAVCGDFEKALQWSLHEFVPAAGYSGAVVCEGRKGLRMHAHRSTCAILEPPLLLRRKAAADYA